MPAVIAVKAGEALGEVAAAVEFLDDFDHLCAEGTVGFPVRGLISRLEFIPSVVNDLPEWRSSRTAWTINGRHNCLFEQLSVCNSKIIVFLNRNHRNIDTKPD